MSDEFVMKPLAKHVNNETPVEDNRNVQEKIPQAHPTSTLPLNNSNTSPSVVILQDLFMQFINKAELKLNSLLFKSIDTEIDLFSIFKTGNDLAFDQLLSAIGKISKTCPKLIIDSIMVWRKSKSENIDDLPDHVYISCPALSKKAIESIVKERKSLISNFILCRALSDIIGQLDKNSMSAELGTKLEDMVFGQLKNADPVTKSINRQANIEFFSQLIGALSHISVSQKFLSSLTVALSMKEARLEMILQSMKYMKMKLYPMEDLERTVEFLGRLSELYQSAHGKMKTLYTEVLVDIFEPIIAIINAEVNVPGWMTIVETLFPKALKIYQKSKTSLDAFKLLTSILCVSKKEFFDKQFASYNEMIAPRFKEKTLKPESFQCYLKIIWVYLYRNTETSKPLLHGNIDSILKLFLNQQTFKKNFTSALTLNSQFIGNNNPTFPNDIPLNLYVLFCYYVAMKDLDFFVNLILPYLSGITVKTSSDSRFSTNIMNNDSRSQMHTDTNSFFSGSSISTLDFETAPITSRIVLFRLYDLILMEMESYFKKSVNYGNIQSQHIIVEERIHFPIPLFPTSDVLQKCSSSNIDFSEISRLIKPHEQQSPEFNHYSSVLPNSFWNRAGVRYREVHETIQSLTGKHLRTFEKRLEAEYSQNFVRSDGPRRKGSHDRNDSQDSNDALEESLFLTIIDSLPRLVPKDMGIDELIQILIKLVLFGSLQIGYASIYALKRVITWTHLQKEGSIIVLIQEVLMKLVCFEYPTLLMTLTNNNKHPLKMCLDAWIWSIEYSLDLSKSSIQSYGKYKAKFIDIVDKIEAVGYFFLLSDVYQIRECAVRVIECASRLNEALLAALNARRANKNSRNSMLVMKRNAQKTPNTMNLLAHCRLEIQNTRLLAILKKHGKLFVEKHCTDVFRKLRVKKADQITHKQNFFERSDMILLQLAVSPLEVEDAIWTKCLDEIHKIAYTYATGSVLQDVLKYTNGAILKMHPLIVKKQELHPLVSPTNSVRNGGGSFIMKTLNRSIQFHRLLECSFCLIDISKRIGFRKLTRSHLESVEETNTAIEVPLYSRADAVLNADAIFQNAQLSAICSARHLLLIIIPFLTVDHDDPRAFFLNAVKHASESSQIDILSDLVPYMRAAINHVKARVALKEEITDIIKSTMSQFKVESNLTIPVAVPINTRMDNYCIHFTDLLGQACNFISNGEVKFPDSLITEISIYVREFGKFLSEGVTDFNQLLLQQHFCVLVHKFYNYLVDISEADPTVDVLRYFSFETRYKFFKLFSDWGTKNTISVESNPIVSEDISRIILSFLNCMATLCRGPLEDPLHSGLSFDLDLIMVWIKDILSSEDSRLSLIGKIALKNLISFNIGNRRLMNDMTIRGYHSGGASKTSYFDALADALLTIFQSSHSRAIEISPFMCLFLFKMGNEDIMVRRKAALVLDLFGSRGAPVDDTGDSYSNMKSLRKTISLQSLISIASNEVLESTYPLGFENMALLNNVQISYKYAQAMLSAKFSELIPDSCFPMINEITKCINVIHTEVEASFESKRSRIQDLLVILIPWLRIASTETLKSTSVHLESVDAVGMLLESEFEVVINNLVFLSILFAEIFITEIETIWIQFLEFQSVNQMKKTDFTIFVKLIHQLSVQTKNTFIIETAQRISICISRSKAGAVYLEELCDIISPKTIRTISSKNMFLRKTASEDVFVVNLIDCIPEHPKKTHLSLCHTAIILVASFVLEVPSQIVSPFICGLLHASLCHVDHSVSIIHDQSRMLLLNLIKCLTGNKEDGDVSQLCDNLMLFDGKRLWPYEDRTGKSHSLTSEIILGEYVIRIVDALYHIVPNLIEHWTSVSVEWGTKCPIRHVACRSFQIYRVLISKVDDGMFSEMFNRLSNIIADSNYETQGLSLEIISSFKTIIETLEDAEFFNAPSLIWFAIACLSSPIECEFQEGVKILQILINRINLMDSNQIRFIMASKPLKWKSEFNGIQSLLIRGLSSSKCYIDCLVLINTLSLIPNSSFVDSRPCKNLFSILANVGDLVKSFDETSTVDTKQLLSLGAQLSTICESSHQMSLMSCLSNYAAQQYRSKSDFLGSLSAIVKHEYLRSYHKEIIDFIVIMLHNSSLNGVYLEFFKSFVSALGSQEYDILGPQLLKTVCSCVSYETGECAKDSLIDIIKTTYGRQEINLRMVMCDMTIDHLTAKASVGCQLSEDSVWYVSNREEAAQNCRDDVLSLFSHCHSIMNGKINSHIPSDTPKVELNLQNEVDSFAPEGPLAEIPEKSFHKLHFNEILSTIPDMDIMSELLSSPGSVPVFKIKFLKALDDNDQLYAHLNSDFLQVIKSDILIKIHVVSIELNEPENYTFVTCSFEYIESKQAFDLMETFIAIFSDEYSREVFKEGTLFSCIDFQWKPEISVVLKGVNIPM